MGTRADFAGNGATYGRDSNDVVHRTDVPPVGLKNDEAFDQYASNRGEWQEIPGHRGNARVVDGPLGQEVWVRPEYGGYRDAFETVHGEQPSGVGNAGVQIDHAFARRGAQHAEVSLDWVLVGAVMGNVNMSHGRMNELAIRGDVTAADVPSQVEAAPFQMQKMLNIEPSDGFSTSLVQPRGDQLTRREALSVDRYINGFNSKA